MSGLSGIAAVLAAIGLSADSKDSVSRAALDSAITAALAEGEKAGIVKAGNEVIKIKADATVAERGRAKAILVHADAKGREDLAAHLAFDTDMTAEAATAMLGKAPKGGDVKTSRLEGNVPNPQVEPGTEPVKPGDGLNAAVDGMVAAQKKRLA
ncbi:hypothetical protein JQ633_12545 [Bradyrhizobium tropiciagri]|uniref:hypothetical protein n=1 Tax=Bradyrhizobium tropiciagri TaxID=312253 RepID=UPI001BAC5F98|nr:hypothetical protein [Bradyrhizobium tropiciagri]MBR0871192.1 hypothetical protein [Bradyrhizobium tropiciagri]